MSLENEGNVFEMRTPDCEPGSWWIVLLPADFKEGDKITPQDCYPVYHASGSLAEDYVGPQIAIDLLRKGAKVGLMFNSNEVIIWPNVSMEGDE